MNEVIHSEHLFEIRRLKADVERAESADGYKSLQGKYTQEVIQAQFQALWGQSRVAAPEHKEAQRKANEYFRKLVFPPKPKED